MKTIGDGVREIRINQDGQFRVIYIAKLEDTIYALHAPQNQILTLRRQPQKQQYTGEIMETFDNVWDALVDDSATR